MDYENLVLEVARDVATVTLNRPEKLNALNRGLQLEILRVRARAEAAPGAGPDHRADIIAAFELGTDTQDLQL